MFSGHEIGEKNWSAIRTYFSNPRTFWLAIFSLVWPFKYFLACQFPFLACHLAHGTLLFHTLCFYITVKKNPNSKHKNIGPTQKGVVLRSTWINCCTSRHLLNSKTLGSIPVLALTCSSDTSDVGCCGGGTGSLST